MFLFSYFVGIFMFNYLVWKRKHLQQFVALYGFEISNLDLLALKDTSLPSRSCMLPDTICKCVSADMFLVSITAWSLIDAIWCGLQIIREVWTMLREITLR